MERISWFVECKPSWHISSEMLWSGEGHAHGKLTRTEGAESLLGFTQMLQAHCPASVSRIGRIFFSSKRSFVCEGSCHSHKPLINSGRAFISQQQLHLSRCGWIQHCSFQDENVRVLLTSAEGWVRATGGAQPWRRPLFKMIWLQGQQGGSVG